MAYVKRYSTRRDRIDAFLGDVAAVEKRYSLRCHVACGVYNDADRNTWRDVFEFLDFPMGRDLTKPGDAGVAEGGARVETARNGAGDKRPALLGQQSEHPLLRRHQRI